MSEDDASADERVPRQGSGDAPPARSEETSGAIARDVEASSSYQEEFAGGRLQRLDPAVRKVWAIKLCLVWAVILLAAGAYDAVSLFSDSSVLAPGIAVSAAVLGGIFVCTVIPGLRFRFWRYALLDQELYLERGIVNRVQTVVPLRRIQHLDVSQDLIEREFDLARLIVHTAGTRSSDVVVPGLSYRVAERLRDDVKLFILEDTI